MRCILTASSFAVGREVCSTGPTKVTPEALKSLELANIAIGAMFEKMPVNIIDMAECGFEFATHIEKFVMTMSQVVSARPKMKKL